jgi:hypothetical protein
MKASWPVTFFEYVECMVSGYRATVMRVTVLRHVSFIINGRPGLRALWIVEANAPGLQRRRREAFSDVTLITAPQPAIPI